MYISSVYVYNIYLYLYIYILSGKYILYTKYTYVYIYIYKIYIYMLIPKIGLPPDHPQLHHFSIETALGIPPIFSMAKPSVRYAISRVDPGEFTKQSIL